MTKKRWLIYVCSVCTMLMICGAVLTAAVFFIIGNPVVLLNNQKLKQAVCSLKSGEIVSLNETVPFAWDVLYTFEPYQSRAEIEQIIGFRSNDIQENDVNEGMVHLLFVKGGKVAASVLGYSGNLGYGIDFAAKENRRIAYAENAQFTATKIDGITMLKYCE